MRAVSIEVNACGVFQKQGDAVPDCVWIRPSPRVRAKSPSPGIYEGRE